MKKNKTSNNVLEIVNGKYIRGQLEKGVLGGGQKVLFIVFVMIMVNNGIVILLMISKYRYGIYETSSFSVGISDLISNTTTNNLLVN